MKKKYQVFVSSTYTDLIEERKVVMQALLELDCIPVGMELFPAADEDQWTLIKKLIDDCDYYLIIAGGRYGSVNSDNVGYTQLEYEYALKKEIPIIGFLHKDPSQIPVGKTDTSPELVEKLKNFKALIQKKLVKYWESPADLESKISRSLVKLIEEKPRQGWVKSQVGEHTDENLKKEVDDLKLQLHTEQQKNKMLTNRLLDRENSESNRKQYYEEFSNRKNDKKA